MTILSNNKAMGYLKGFPNQNIMIDIRLQTYPFFDIRLFTVSKFLSYGSLVV